jgi:hypothetical protein
MSWPALTWVRMTCHSARRGRRLVQHGARDPVLADVVEQAAAGHVADRVRRAELHEAGQDDAVDGRVDGVGVSGHVLLHRGHHRPDHLLVVDQVEGDRVDGLVGQQQAVVVERVLAREDGAQDLGRDRVRGLAALDGVMRWLARTFGSDAASAPRSRSESISRTRNDMPRWARAMTLRRSPPFMAYRTGRGPRQMYRSHGSVEISVSTRAGTGSYPGGAGVMKRGRA